ncbi:unnamed protein product [Linum tenue]|uniref:Uncharacterized protein n=1 Tax=Linum tenue TaxID=586396 RepID=A0AAV0IAZ5_9ROSI|nr:unnamed protein product [Linum tenue]
MVASFSPSPVTGKLPLFSSPASSAVSGLYLPSTKWGFGVEPDVSSGVSRTKGRAFRISATANASGSLKKVVIMVDPAEAKRLAAKQMVEIRRKERLKRTREIEAINGAWAMIGLTAGLLIEGYSGKTMIEQLAGYLYAIFHIFIR